MDLQPIAYSIQAAVKVSGVGRTSLYEAIKAGALPVRKYGSRTLVRYEDLKQFVDDLPFSKTIGEKDV